MDCAVVEFLHIVAQLEDMDVGFNTGIGSAFPFEVCTVRLRGANGQVESG